MFADTIEIIGTLIVGALGQTLLIATSSWALALVIGVVVALAVDGRGRWVGEPYFALSTAVRGIPEVLAIYLLVYGLSSQGFRMTPLVAVVIALGVVQAAFASEAFGGCLLLVGRGQRLAAESFGLSRWQAYRRVILPQAMTSFVPAAVNLYVSLLKLSTIASAVGVGEMLYFGRAEMERRHEMFATTLALAILYLAITIPLTQLALHRDRRANTGVPQSTQIRFS